MQQAPSPAAFFSWLPLLAAASVPPLRVVGQESAWARWSPAAIQAARVLAQMRSHGPDKTGLPQISTAGTRYYATLLPNPDLIQRKRTGYDAAVSVLIRRSREGGIDPPAVACGVTDADGEAGRSLEVSIGPCHRQ